MFTWIALTDFYGWIIHSFGSINDGWLSPRNKSVAVIYLYIYWNRWAYSFCHVLILNLLEIFSPCSCSRLMWWTTSSRTAGTASLSFRRWSGWDWLLPWPSSSSYCLDSPCSPPSPPRTDLTIPREKPLPSMLMNSCECWIKFCITISTLSWLVLHPQKNLFWSSTYI